MKDATTCFKFETKNVSTMTSVVNADSGIQGVDETVNFDEVVSFGATVHFDETLHGLPYDEETDIIKFNMNLKDPKFWSNVVSLINTYIYQETHISNLSDWSDFFKISLTFQTV